MLDDLFRDFSLRVRSGAQLPIVHKAFGAKPLVGQISEAQLTKDLSRQLRESRKSVSRLRAQIATPETEWRSEIETRIENEIRKRLERRIRKETKEKLRDEIAYKRKLARKALADELKKARKKAAKLHSFIANLEIEQKRMEHAMRIEAINNTKRTRERMRAILCNVASRLTSKDDKCSTYSHAVSFVHYPPVPHAMISVDDCLDPNSIPEQSGIYFFWQDDIVVYVGQSVNLRARVCGTTFDRGRRLTHEHSHGITGISYLVVEKIELTWAENFYIGLTRSVRNYGMQGAHNRYANKVKPEQLQA